jgi:hypothetical protein
MISFLFQLTFAQENSGRIYGKVELANGQNYEGRITWSNFKSLWENKFVAFDFTSSRIPVNPPPTGGRADIYNRNVRPSVMYPEPFSIKFGYIKYFTKLERGAKIILKDGREINLFEGDTDNQRSIDVLDPDAGKVRIPLYDLRKVEFIDESQMYSQKVNENAYPLYGTVNTKIKLAYTGFIQWGDKTLSVHSLRSREREHVQEIAFNTIRLVRSMERGSYEVILLTGKKIELRNLDNRGGVLVADKRYGIIEIDWDNIASIEFVQEAKGLNYSDYKPGKPLYGTVADSIGTEYTGYIRWDNHERFTTDEIDGDFGRGITFSVELTLINEIKRQTRNSAIIKLISGDEIILRNDIDVAQGNRGIFILNKPDDKEGTVLNWNNFNRVVFKY